MDIRDHARKYVERKFGQHEAGYLMLKHETIRYVIEDFFNEHLAQELDPLQTRQEGSTLSDEHKPNSFYRTEKKYEREM